MDLYKLRSVCMTTRDTMDHPFVWKHYFETDLLVLSDVVPCVPELEPSELHSTVLSLRRCCGIDAAEMGKWSISPMRWSTWPLMYRACAKKLQSIQRDVSRFEQELEDLQSLRRERGQIKALTQTKGKRTGTEMRRSQLSCIKYINKSTRRMWAADNQPTSTMSKSEMHNHLSQIDAALKESSAAVFTLRNQLRKEYRKVLGFLAAARLHSTKSEMSRAA
ncbi:hypothetical protein LEN26_014956 [Aphanomyces euteiches]|nr:hypothetical protein LEN26_014956 [Aphanomyces euteiches]KAH9186877.1 hypothetical protein AeNC1_011149 [Aphanomyces euteiches]